MLVQVPGFNPLYTKEDTKLRLLPIPTIVKRVNDVEDDTDEKILKQMGENEVEMRQDEDPVQEVQSSSRTRSPEGCLTHSSSRRRNSATPVSLFVSSQKSDRLSGVKLKLNNDSNSSVKLSRTTLLSNKFLLVGRRLLRYVPSVGNFYETVKCYNLSKDLAKDTLKFSDDSWEEITFDDVMKLIPKSW